VEGRIWGLNLARTRNFRFSKDVVKYCLGAGVNGVFALYRLAQLFRGKADISLSFSKRFWQLLHINEDFLMGVEMFLSLLNLRRFLPNFNQFSIVCFLPVYLILCETSKLAHVARAVTKLILGLSNVETVQVILILLAVLLFGLNLLLCF
jgi:hypothetical protein